MKGCPYCSNDMNKEKEYEIEDDASIKDSVLAELMETMSKGMGSKLKSPAAISIEIEKPISKMSKMKDDKDTY